MSPLIVAAVAFGTLSLPIVADLRTAPQSADSKRAAMPLTDEKHHAPIPVLTQTELLTTVERIRRADFEDDRSLLRDIPRELAIRPLPQSLTGAFHYWMGFAAWRRAINGFNDGVGPAESGADLNTGVSEFTIAAESEPYRPEALIGQAGCLMSLIYLDYADVSKRQAHIKAFAEAGTKLSALDPDNPRWSWIMGTSRFSRPASAGQNREEAWTLFEKGLDTLRNSQAPRTDPLFPSWGEPEILMSMSFSALHKSPPDLAQAESYANQALGEVPRWHYVREVLLPQIRAAKANLMGNAPVPPAIH